MPTSIPDPFGLLSYVSSTTVEDDCERKIDRFKKIGQFERSSNICKSCNIEMQRDINDIYYICRLCNSIEECDNLANIDNEITPSGRIRIVGADSIYLQHNLYRDDFGKTVEQFRTPVYNDYMNYLNKYKEKTDRLAFPLDAIQLATDYYCEVKKFGTRRADYKSQAMAKCLEIACYNLKYSPSSTDLYNMFKLKHNGLSTGTRILFEAKQAGFLSFEINFKPQEADIITLFSHIEELLTEDEYSQCLDATHKIVGRSNELKLGTQSKIKSKVVGSAFVVLSRRKNPKNVIPVISLCNIVNTKPNTIEKFTKILSNYHSRFKDIYKNSDLKTN